MLLVVPLCGLVLFGMYRMGRALHHGDKAAFQMGQRFKVAAQTVAIGALGVGAYWKQQDTFKVTEPAATK